MLSKTARLNWKIAKYLYKKKKNEELERQHQIVWQRLQYANQDLVTPKQFVADFLTYERRKKSEIDLVDRLNVTLNTINMENSKLKHLLMMDEKLNFEKRIENSNHILSWKNDIKNEQTNKLKYIQQREHSHGKHHIEYQWFFRFLFLLGEPPLISHTFSIFFLIFFFLFFFSYFFFLKKQSNY